MAISFAGTGSWEVTDTTLTWAAISVWVKPHLVVGVDGTRSMNIICLSDPGRTRYTFQLAVWQNFPLSACFFSIYFQQSAGSFFVKKGDTQLITDTWYHIMLTIPVDDSRFQILVNGNDDDLFNNIFPTWSTGWGVTVATDWIISGAVSTDTTYNAFNGQMSDVAVWNDRWNQRILYSYRGVTKLYSTPSIAYYPLQIDPGSLRFYLPMNEATDGAAVTSLRDHGPNLLTPVLTGSCTGVTNPVVAYP
jgi:hypothetical protein